jgi:hypothetical protein
VVAVVGLAVPVCKYHTTSMPVTSWIVWTGFVAVFLAGLNPAGGQVVESKLETDTLMHLILHYCRISSLYSICPMHD